MPEHLPDPLPADKKRKTRRQRRGKRAQGMSTLQADFSDDPQNSTGNFMQPLDQQSHKYGMISQTRQKLDQTRTALLPKSGQEASTVDTRQMTTTYLTRTTQAAKPEPSTTQRESEIHAKVPVQLGLLPPAASSASSSQNMAPRSGTTEQPHDEASEPYFPPDETFVGYVSAKQTVLQALLAKYVSSASSDQSEASTIEAVPRPDDTVTLVLGNNRQTISFAMLMSFPAFKWIVRECLATKPEGFGYGSFHINLDPNMFPFIVRSLMDEKLPIFCMPHDDRVPDPFAMKILKDQATLLGLAELVQYVERLGL